MTYDIETVVLVLVLFAVWTIILPAIAARPILIAWETLPRAARFVVLLVLPTLIPIVNLVFGMVDEIVTIRVNRTPTPVDNLAWEEIKQQYRNIIERLEQLEDTQNIVLVDVTNHEIVELEDGTTLTVSVEGDVINEVKP